MKMPLTLLVALSLPLFLAGCLTDEPHEPGGEPGGTVDGMTINNDEAELSDRVTDKNEPVELDTTGTGQPAGKRAATKTLTMTLIAQIASPVVGGDTLQASSVHLSGNYAYVSYNLRGEKYRGGVDIIHMKTGSNAVLNSQVLFDSTDVHALYFSGSVWLAAAQAGASPPAMVEKLDVTSGKFVVKARVRTQLSSYAATSVVVDGNKVYATSGNTGHLYVLDNALKKTDSLSLPDARWVDTHGGRVVVAQGVPGKLTAFGTTNLLSPTTIAAGGAGIPESKTTVRVINNKAIMAAGDGGLKVFNLATGKLIGSVARTKVAGLDSAVTVTNAADGANELIYASNGEAGIYVILSTQDLENSTGDADMGLTVLGKLKFSNFQSANHVSFDGNTLVVAAGKGGVKIVTVKYQ
jgi:hypothetical protein